MADNHKLWGGRFSVPTAHALDELNRSIGTDFRLWPFDVKLSQAWASALQSAGIYTNEERDAVIKGLDVVAEQISNGAQPIETDEDIHTMIDRLLHTEVGDPASKLHTGRSRNDQVATAARMWTMDALGRVESAVAELQRVMLRHAEEQVEALMPAYTHLQRAQPVSVAHWMLNHFWPLQRDRSRLAYTQSMAAVLPLGSGAIAGSAYAVPREQIRQDLNFSAISPNSIDATGDRDFIVDSLYAITMIATHLSRLAEDLIIYGTSEFGFVKFGDAFSTGSSMMPQKRNPDALEIARGSAARMLGDLVSLLATLKGLPSGYSKDLQDDKRVLFDAVDTMMLVLPAVTGALDEIKFNTEKMSGALSSTMMATDLADYLVNKGVTFREAHAVVGKLVRESEVTGIDLNMMPYKTFGDAHPQFDQDVFEWLSAIASVERRSVPGGTGLSAVRDQLEVAKQAAA